MSIPTAASAAPPTNAHLHPEAPLTSGTVRPARSGASGMADMCTAKATPWRLADTCWATSTLAAGPARVRPAPATAIDIRNVGNDWASTATAR